MELAKHNQPFSHIGSKNTGIIIIHGFTSTTSSMQYIADKLAENGFHIELPSLPGHGTKWQDLSEVTFQDWLIHLESNLETLKNRAENVFVLGLSLGGGLALRLAEQHQEIAGLILINHVCKFTHPKFWFVPLLRILVSSTPAIGSDIKDPQYKEIGYSRTPIEGTYQMLQLLKQVRKDLSKVNQPVLMLKSKDDHVVPIRSTTFTFEKISSSRKKIVWLENSYHVATLDYDKDLIVENSLEFINTIF